jgi:hypothetical protein
MTLAMQVGDLLFFPAATALTYTPVPYYQPETSYRIFQRVMSNLDVSLGKISTLKVPKYQTKGPYSVFSVKNKTPTFPKAQCYLWDVLETCTPEQGFALLTGKAITKNFIVTGIEK